jgi:transcriptional regulator with XRE-family HTH domain
MRRAARAPGPGRGRGVRKAPERKRKAPGPADPQEMINKYLGRRVRELRIERDWSLDGLSSACGVSRSMLSQIERSDVNPTLAVAYRIAHAFGMTLAELVEMPSATSSVEVIRADDRAYQFRSDRDCTIRTLSPLHLEKDVELYQVRLKQGGALRSQPHFEGTREFLTVAKGRVRIESGDDSEELGTGDSASYRADVVHAIVNIGKGEALVFLVDIYR